MSKTSKGINNIFLLISIVLYIIVPRSKYVFDYCLLLHNLFLIQNIVFFSLNKKRIIDFHFLFAVGFYLVTFVYPVFYYVTDARYSKIFHYNFNENIITYSTAVSYFAYNCYLLGMALYRSKKHIVESQINISPKIINNSFNFLIIAFVFFVWGGGLTFYVSTYFDGNSVNSPLAQYSILIFHDALLLLVLLLFLNYGKYPFKKLHLITVIFSVIFLLSTGTRGIPLEIISMAFILYNDKIKKLPIKYFLIIILTGAVLFGLMGALRAQQEQKLSDVTNGFTSLFDPALDLIMCNRGLYVLTDYADNYHYMYFLPQFDVVLGVVPFLSGIVVDLMGVNPWFTSSAKFNTFLSAGQYAETGLGTHIVGDMYISFGIIGVVVAFVFFGYIIEKARDLRKKSIYYYFLYFIIVSQAVVISRGTMFIFLKEFVYISIIYYFIKKISTSKRSKTLNKKVI